MADRSVKSLGVPGFGIPIHQRMAMLIDAAGGTGPAAEIAGVARDTINNWRKEGATLPLQKVLRLAEEVGVSLDWVATGHQVRLDLQAGGGEAGPLLQIPGNDGFALIPRLEVEASAGGGALAAEEDVGGLIAFRAEWLRRVGVNPRSARALKARGDSMEPTIRDGDILLVDSSIDRIIDEGIYVVVVAGLALVKRLAVRRDGTIVLKSDNAARYTEEMIPREEATELSVAGRVMWFGRSI